MDIHVVIGANYGDEGKGLVTNYLSSKYTNGIIVLNNGGAQRGHTVETQSGFHHVFHHFGSTTNPNFISYCSEFFIINPLVWKKEFEELNNKYIFPSLYIHPDCKVSTPYDMMLNQLVELNRGENRHGSCGIGIWETLQRHKEIPFTFSQVLKFNEGDIASLENKLLIYFKKKLEEYRIDKTLLASFLEGINFQGLFNNFIYDLFTMSKVCHTAKLSDLCFSKTETIIIENGQGLLLDNSVDAVHSTPSNTGLTNVKSILDGVNYSSINACYVSRTYITKHGAGNFPGECDKNNVSNLIGEDKTNHPNDYQGSLRFANLNVEDLISRIKNDNPIECTKSLFLTHCNEIEKEKVEEFKNILLTSSTIDKLYLSKDYFTAVGITSI
jgi:adenylosuccinate synthase